MLLYRLSVSFLLICHFFFFKQKPAYELCISDWSSDVCSSDLEIRDRGLDLDGHHPAVRGEAEQVDAPARAQTEFGDDAIAHRPQQPPDAARHLGGAVRGCEFGCSEFGCGGGVLHRRSSFVFLFCSRPFCQRPEPRVNPRSADLSCLPPSPLPLPWRRTDRRRAAHRRSRAHRSEEHTSELKSLMRTS